MTLFAARNMLMAGAALLAVPPASGATQPNPPAPPTPAACEAAAAQGRILPSCPRLREEEDAPAPGEAEDDESGAQLDEFTPCPRNSPRCRPVKPKG